MRRAGERVPADPSGTLPLSLAGDPFFLQTGNGTLGRKPVNR